MRYLSLAACVACVFALTIASPVAAQVPSLSGETFVATGDIFALPPGTTPGDMQVTGTCDPDGTSTFSFQASGPAAGPYPGTFEESGTFTIQGPAVSGDLLVLVDFQATFTIDSVNGQVDGTKSFTGTVPGASTTCREDPFRVFSGLAPTHYEATITTATGTFTTEGEAESSLGYEEAAPGEPFADMVEFFNTGSEPEEEEEEPPPPPDVPTDKEACKDRGFEDFPAQGFKNQGDCVAFVETGGKNEPGQNVPGLP